MVHLGLISCRLLLRVSVWFDCASICIALCTSCDFVVVVYIASIHVVLGSWHPQKAGSTPPVPSGKGYEPHASCSVQRQANLSVGCPGLCWFSLFCCVYQPPCIHRGYALLQVIPTISPPPRHRSGIRHRLTVLGSWSSSVHGCC